MRADWRFPPFTGERCGWVFLYYLYIDCFLTFARGTCLAASLVCIAISAISDDSPISDETIPVAEGVYSIGILICVLCVSVFVVVEELWDGFETA